MPHRPTGPSARLRGAAVTLGALVAAFRDAADFKVLVAVLSVGQLLAHAVLGAAGHSHSATAGAPPSLMIGAHLAAIAVGAALITIGGHLCAAVSRALSTSSPRPRCPVASPPSTVVVSADQSRQSALGLATSVSHRGPPVSLAR